MERAQLLTILVAIILVLTLVNTYGTFSMQRKFNDIGGQVTALTQKADENSMAAENQAPGQPQKPSRISVSADDDPSKGSKNAPVTIVEFSDFQCPYCGKFYSQTLPSIEEQYIKTGKVKLVFRDFPLGFHQYAQKASEASECADEQGKFWEYHNKLFDNQGALALENLKQYAKDLGLNEAKFNDCLGTSKMATEVKKDASDGSSYGVSGTPAFFINGILIEGAYPFESFKQVIDSELAK